MRLRAIAFAFAATAIVGFGAWRAGELAADFAEDRATAGLRTTLAEAGHDWAQVRADGLAVSLSGEAPDETARFHAIEIARQRLTIGRLEDRIAVASPGGVEAPAVSLELLRSGGDVSLIGLVPEAGARETIAAGLAAAGIGATVTDMLETVAHPAPPGWEPALDYALDVLAALPRAKVKVEPGHVAVTAVAEDAGDLATLVERLEAAAPAGVAVELDLGSPRPVIAPYSVALRVAPNGTARLVTCSAETEEDAARIVAAAETAGLAEPAECRIGLGAPSADWADAVARGFAALAELGSGSFTVSDLDAVLVGPPEAEPARLAAIGAALGADLPRAFSLATRSAARLEDEDGEPVAFAPEFQAILLEDGSVRLAGPLADRTSQIAVVGFAEAVFGHHRVMNTTVLDPNLPEGWPARVLSGVEALSLLEEGTLAVTADTVAVSGRSLNEEAGRELETFLAAKSVGPALVDVVFDAETVARLEAEAAPPAEEVCAEAVTEILADRMILFEIGSARIDSESSDLLAEIAGALDGCPGARFEVSGHTDSQGRRSLNQELSEERAAAVVAALAEIGLRDVELRPAGYGPDRPIADNETEEGRALNRRIEFSLIPDEAEDEAALTPADDEGAVSEVDEAGPAGPDEEEEPDDGA